jgi:hypothetical protein
MSQIKNISKLSFAIITILLSVNIDGQSFDIGKSHQLSISFSRQSLTDDHLNLNDENINSTGFSWSYTDKTSRQQKSIGVGFKYGNNINFKTSGYAIEFKNAYSIFRSRQAINYFGYSFKTNFQFIYANEKPSWVSVNAGSLYNSFNYSWGKNLVSFDALIPVIGFISRPKPEGEYDGSVNSMLYNSLSNPIFISLHNYREVNLSLNYSRQVNNRFSLLAGLSFTNQNIQTVNDLRKQEYIFKAGFKYFVK